MPAYTYRPANTRTYWGYSPSIAAFYEQEVDPCFNSYSDTWGDTALRQGGYLLNDIEGITIYTGNAYGCIGNFKNDGAHSGTLNATIESELADKTIVSATIQFTRASSGGSDNKPVRLWQCGLTGAQLASVHSGDVTPNANYQGTATNLGNISRGDMKIFNLPLVYLNWWLAGKTNVVCYGASNYMLLNGGSSVILTVTTALDHPTLTKPAGVKWYEGETPAPVKESPHSFSCDASSDTFGAFGWERLSYEFEFSADGNTWSGTKTSLPGVANISNDPIDIKSFLGLRALQYYYKADCYARARAKTPDWPEGGGGIPYHSADAISPTFAVDYRLTPTAPTISLQRDGISVTSVYEGEIA